ARHSAFSRSSFLEHLDFVDLEEILAVYLVDREERGGHPSQPRQELAPRDAELLCGLVGQLLDACLHVFLLLRLGERHVLAVGNHPRRNRPLRGLPFRGLASSELLVAQPRIFFARTGKSFWICHGASFAHCVNALTSLYRNFKPPFFLIGAISPARRVVLFVHSSSLSMYRSTKL